MTFVLNVLAAPFAAWWGLWATLAVAARRRPRPVPDGGVRRIDVVVPAHDEEARIGALVESLRAQEAPELLGRVLVVADHCSDRTAEVARSAGAEVLVRDDGAAGKPPALRDGLARLRAADDRGDAVVLVDADCVCEPAFLGALARRTGPDVQVVQAAYTLEEPGRDAVRGGLKLGFALRNVVRARGADNLGLPLVLFGSGMLFRWEALDHLSFGDPRLEGTGDSRPVADDVLMALDLVSGGVHPRFAGDAGVVAPTPDDEHALGAQRLRWEGGQALMWRRMPGTARALVARRDWRGLLALVDWTAPPMAPSVAAVGTLGAVGVVAVTAGVAGPAALVVPTAAGCFLAVYLVLGVSELEGREGVVRLVSGAPRFLAWKAGLYLRHKTARKIA